ncbi:MAG: MFS transporter, partial [Defluviitaleaceae bacterium]|nr:MFS transporter [Defluviitaleaceae bacterium]
FLNMYNSIGQAVAMLAGGLTAGYFGYRYPFAAGAFIGIGGIAFGLLVKEKKPERGGHVGVAELLSVIRDKNLLAMSALAIVSQFVFFGTTLTFVPLVAAGLGASPEELGFLSTLGNVPRILASLICGVLLARRFDSKIALASSYALFAVSCAATPFCPNLGALYAVNSATGFAYGVTMAITISLCTRDVEDYRRSAAMGFFQAIYGVGMFIGPVVVGVVSDNIGVNAGFYFAAIAAASGIAASLKFVRKA